MGLFSKGKQSITRRPIHLNKTIVIGGEAGEGIKSAGKLIALALIKSGYKVFVYDEYPSLIRGGHNIVNVTYSAHEVYSPDKEIDILICLNKETFTKLKRNLNNNSVVLYDRSEFQISDQELETIPCQLVEIPALELINKENLPRITKNILYVSASLLVAGVKKETIEETIKTIFGDKPKALPDNIRALEISYTKLYEYFNMISLDKSHTEEKKEDYYLMSGNEAVVAGAIKSKLQFYSAYPMTPSSTILDNLFAYYKEFNVVVKQTEDEIAAINMAIGASFAGARAMVGTAGGGFSLMVEGLGLAAITEVPLVIIVSQRPGPATGLPTWTGQGDLMFILHASQDEFPRIVLCPTDAEECFNLSFLALNLAEKYQLPVFILLDKFISESEYHFKIEQKKDEKIDRGLLLKTKLLARLDNFHRYEFTENGISPRSIPGQLNGIYLANSDESDTRGYTSEDDEIRKKKVEKRFLKAVNVKKDLPSLNYYGDMKSKLAFITWGSVKGATLEAMRRLNLMGKDARLLALNYLDPFPTDEIKQFVKNANHLVVIENNYTGQLSDLIQMKTGIEIKNKLLKYDGRPFYPDEIVDYIFKS